MTTPSSSTVVSPARVESLWPASGTGSSPPTPRSVAFQRTAEASMLYGVPMNWMTRWASPSPVVVTAAHGAELEDIDGNTYGRPVPR